MAPGPCDNCESPHEDASGREEGECWRGCIVHVAHATVNPMNKKLDAFVHALTPKQRVRFAALAQTSVANIRHYITGRRVPSSATAIAMEHAADKLGAELPSLDRRDLNPTCRGCEYARACLVLKTKRKD